MFMYLGDINGLKVAVFRRSQRKDKGTKFETVAKDNGSKLH